MGFSLELVLFGLFLNYLNIVYIRGPYFTDYNWVIFVFPYGITLVEMKIKNVKNTSARYRIIN